MYAEDILYGNQDLFHKRSFVSTTTLGDWLTSCFPTIQHDVIFFQQKDKKTFPQSLLIFKLI
jgi:hypothetical protein